MSRVAPPAIPRALGLVLLCTLILGSAWVMITPPFEGPDEVSHYGYVESVAERHAKPGVEPGQPFSTAQRILLEGTNADVLPRISNGRPQWSESSAEQYARQAKAAPTDDGGGSGGQYFNSARANPPLYYVLEAIPYKLGAATGGVLAPLYVMRLVSVLWLLVGVGAAWLLMGELFGRDRVLQLAGAACVGFLPMMSHLAATVTVDGLLYALWTVVLWLAVRALKQGLNRKTAVALAVATVGAVITKYTSLALVPPVLGVYAYAAGRGTQRARRLQTILATPARRAVAAAGVIALAAVAVLLLANFGPAQFRSQVNGTFVPKQFASYLWQFYLPRLSFLRDIPTVHGIPVYDVWFYDGVGNFGSLQIHQPAWVYPVLGVVGIVVLVFGVSKLVRSQPGVVTALLASVTVLLVAGLHLSDYRTGVLTGIPFMQGRYLFPIIGIFAAIVVAALSRLPRPRQPAAVAMLLGVLIALQVVSFVRAAGFWYV